MSLHALKNEVSHVQISNAVWLSHCRALIHHFTQP
jgi:hypothetical protein